MIGLRLDRVDSYSWVGALLVSGISSALLLSRLFNSLSLLRRSQYFRLLGFRPRLLCFKIFHGGAVHITFVVGLVAALVLLVHFSNKESGLETYFGLVIDRFLNYFCSAVKFLVLLFYLGFY